ncbi:hypothetical protein [Cumulibacter manganitolerans]|uniref:hypothetical protein n=1 Tax=Cumulibacter manganitolerans TaxID=1884992 RepID=UPI0012948DC8|nr:hypothetical protein [Cumulibacter manganitolerans]
MNGPVNSRFAVGPFIAGAPLVLIGVLLIAGLRSSFADILGWIFVVVGIGLLVLSILMFRELSKWNVLRRGKWTTVAATVVHDDAYSEQAKTLIDTVDGKWRIALARYPLELRDVIADQKRLEYVGTLADDASLLVRPTPGELEYFARCRAIASITEARGA